MKLLVSLALLLSVIGHDAQAFVTPSSSVANTRTQTTGQFLSDVPQDEVDEKQASKRKEETWIENNRRRSKNWKDDWLPEPPEDQMTMAGDIGSLFLYSFMNHWALSLSMSMLASSTSAADAAHSLDPTGTDIVVASTPVWLDPTALGPHVSDHLSLLDLQQKVMPHLTPVLSSAGIASVSLASCWIVAGLFHKAFHFRNTLDCSTERAVAVTGQTWVTASILMVILATTTQHMAGASDVQDISTGVLMMQGRTMSPIEEWFSVLTRSDAEYIFDSLGVLLVWRFLMSFLLGGWSKK